MFLKRNNILKIKLSILTAIYLSYIFGFFLRENIAGGAEKDFINLTWVGILSFKDNFLETIFNYGAIGEGSTPMFHIINAYLNPFTYSQYAFQASITLLSILNVIFFSQLIKDKFKLSNIDSYLYSSIFLLLPFYRSSAFWGLTENLGWLFLILSIKFYLDVDKQIPTKLKSKIFLTCLFSSLALYTRPYLIFFPIFILLNLIVKKQYSLLKYWISFFSLFAIPGLILLYIWGGSVYLGVGEEKINFIQEYHQPKFILKNLVIFASIFFFYFAPFHIINYSKKFKLPSRQKIKIFSLILLLLLLLNYFNTFDYLNYNKLGGGAFLKINQIIFNENLIFFLFISYLGIISIINFLEKSKNNFVLLFSVLLIYCTPRYIYQEYFEPLFIILFFTLFNLGRGVDKLIKKDQTILIFIIFYVGYYFSSLYYRYYVTAI